MLEISKIKKATYYYQKKEAIDREKKDQPILEEIRKIFNKNYKKYGYIRVTLALREKGYKINKKRVYRIMKENNLKAAVTRKKYKSYRGERGVRVDNLLEQKFISNRPYEKMGTDLSQFTTPYGKLYVSPIIDFNTREILAYDVSTKPDFTQIKRMLKMLEIRHGKKLKAAIIQSDQGWQYRMKYYQKFIKEQGMIQSMSRKGNCLDNSPTENFFGRMKEEMYYGKEHEYKSIEDLKKAVEKYIKYYNNERIVNRLKTSPIKYKGMFYNEKNYDTL